MENRLASSGALPEARVKPATFWNPFCILSVDTGFSSPWNRSSFAEEL